MNSEELKNSLTSIANVIEIGGDIYPYRLDKQLIDLLSNLDDRSAKLIASLLDMPVDNFKKLIPNIISLLKAAEPLFASEDKRIVRLCQKLANSPLILSVISKFI